MSFYWDEMMEKIEKDGSLIYKDKVSTFWGEDWRLPSKTEFEELLVCCVWTPKKILSIDKQYYKVTGPNGNSIYFYADRDVSLMSSTGPSCCLILGEPYISGSRINIVSNNDRKCYIRPITE